MKLQLYLNENFLEEYDLVVGQEYLVGRAESCDIVLNEKSGISRKHLKIILTEEQTLQVNLISKLGELKFENELAEELLLEVGNDFFIKNFKFSFQQEAFQKNETNQEKTSEPRSLREESGPQTDPLQTEEKFDKTDPVESSELILTEKLDSQSNAEEFQHEHTVTAINTLGATLHILSSSSGRVKRSYELDGSSWLVGRDKSCSLYLNYKFMSRKHFEITKTNDGFYVCDYGSANGTSLNQKKLNANVPVQIYNDDIITVKSLTLKVEIWDEKYQEKVKHLSDQSRVFSDTSDGISKNYTNIDAFEMKKAKANKKLLIIRIAIVLCALFGLYSYMNKGKGTDRKIAGNESSPIDKTGLSKEKLLIANDIYNMAKNNFSQKEHLACLDEIERLHKIIPEFKDSQRMENLCRQGLEIEQEQKIKEERKEQARKIEEKSNKIANQCQQKFLAFKTRLDLETCLNQLLVLNPTHPIINLLQERWDLRELEQAQRAEQARNFQVRSKEGARVFKSAEKTKAQGNLKQALSLFKRYLNSGFPDQNNRKTKAKREIASIRSELGKLASQLMINCKQKFEAKDYKGSFYSCVEVLDKFPSNSEAEEIRTSSLKRLRTVAKGLYADGALEESLGNISAAKEKWNEILKIHIESDEYYRKAKRKLKKYGNDI